MFKDVQNTNDTQNSFYDTLKRNSGQSIENQGKQLDLKKRKNHISCHMEI